MAGGGSSGSSLWKYMMGVGGAVVVLTMALEHAHALPALAAALLLAVGGLSLIFGSCEAMILAVEGLGGRLRWNPYVAGTMAGLASEVPEIIMIGFVVAKDPRVAFVVTILSLHVNALVFGAYSGLLPRDQFGQAQLPKAVVELGADLLSCAAGLVLAVGTLMLTLRAFDAGDHRGEGLGATDLYMIGAVLLAVKAVFILQMLRHFAGDAGHAAADAGPLKGWGWIGLHGALGIGGAFLGGHAVGEFADELVRVLTAHGYSEMIGAIVVSLFSGVAGFLMIGSAHVKGKQDIALSNVANGVTAVPFVVLPFTLIIMAALAQLGVVPRLPHGGVLPIDFNTTGVLLFAFPTLLVLWKSIADDGKISHMETTIMVALFALIIYFIAQHG